MHAWEQIQLTIDYIENHLDEDISTDALAKMAALSPFYYQRLFSRLAKKPVGEYIRLRRMARATEKLLEPNRRILDVAVALGFSSHEHFTRTFKDTFGMTPEAYRRHPQALNRMTKPELLLRYALIDEGVPLITDGIVLEVNRRRLEQSERFAGIEKKTPVSFMEGLGTESGVDPLDALWRDFHQKRRKSWPSTTMRRKLACRIRARTRASSPISRATKRTGRPPTANAPRGSCPGANTWCAPLRRKTLRPW